WGFSLRWTVRLSAPVPSRATPDYLRLPTCLAATGPPCASSLPRCVLPTDAMKRVIAETRKPNVKTLLLTLALCIASLAQENPDVHPALTIYNQNFFVAREHLPLDLKPGTNHIDYSGVAAHVEPDSVILRDPAGRALQILEQNYRNDPVSQELL